MLRALGWLLIVVQLVLIPVLWFTRPSVNESATTIEQLNANRETFENYTFYSLFVTEFIQNDVSAIRSMSPERLTPPGRPLSVSIIGDGHALFAAQGNITSCLIRLSLGVFMLLIAALGLGSGLAPRNGSAALVIAIGMLVTAPTWGPLLLVIPIAVGGIVLGIATMREPVRA